MSRSQPRLEQQRSARRFNITVDIAASPRRVWEVMTDVERWHEWTASIVSVRRLDSGAFRLGSRARVKQPKFLPALWEVTQLTEGKCFTWVTRSPGVRAIGEHTVEPTANGSRATLSVTYGGALGWFAARLLARTTDRFLYMEAAGLKQRSEQAAKN